MAFHQFTRAWRVFCSSRAKTLKQVQGWLRHSQLSTTVNVYIHEVDDSLGSADAWDGVIGPA